MDRVATFDLEREYPPEYPEIPAEAANQHRQQGREQQ